LFFPVDITRAGCFAGAPARRSSDGVMADAPAPFDCNMTTFRSAFSDSPARDSATDPLAQLRSWEPLLLPAFAEFDGHPVDASSVANIVVRSDNARPIASVSPRYNVVLHRTTCALFDELAARGVLTDLRCGEFNGGAKIWIQCRPKQGGIAQVAGHEIRQRLTLLDSHDGSASQKLVDTSVNIRCANTYRLAGTEGFALLRSRHTSGARDRWERAAEGILRATQGWDKEIERLNVWAKTPTQHADLRAVLDKFFPIPQGEQNPEPAQEARNRISWAYEYAPAALPGTRYGIFQAMTYYASHEIGRDRTRAQSLLMGTAGRLIEKTHSFLARLN